MRGFNPCTYAMESNKKTAEGPPAEAAGAPLSAAAPEGATLQKDLHTVEWNGQKSSNLFHLFVNETDEPLDLSWGDEHGRDTRYSTVEPRKNAFVGTYAFHTWRVRSASRGLIASYTGPSVTLTITPEGYRTEPNTHGHMPQHQQQSKQPQPDHRASSAQTATTSATATGTADQTQQLQNGSGAAEAEAIPGYRLRSTVLGMPIYAFDVVSDAAVARLAAIVGSMLIHAPRPLLERLVAGGGSFAIFGKEQVVSDVPAHRFMRYNTGRDLDTSARGLGATPSVPVTSCGEENLTMEGDKWYPCQSILVHEMGHMVHNMGLPATGQDGADAVLEAYRAAKKARLYPSSCYMMTNEQEYWAVAVESWFESTVREDVNGGICNRAALRRHDPQLAKLLATAFGDGEWRYWHDCPKPLAMPSRTAATAAAVKGRARGTSAAAIAAKSRAGAATAAAMAMSMRAPDVATPPQLSTAAAAAAGGAGAGAGSSWRSRRPTRLVVEALAEGSDTSAAVRLLLRRLLCRRFMAIRAVGRSRSGTRSSQLQPQPQSLSAFIPEGAASGTEDRDGDVVSEKPSDGEGQDTGPPEPAAEGTPGGEEGSEVKGGSVPVLGGSDSGEDGSAKEEWSAAARELPVPLPGPCIPSTQRPLTGRRRNRWEVLPAAGPVVAAAAAVPQRGTARKAAAAGAGPDTAFSGGGGALGSGGSGGGVP